MKIAIISDIHGSLAAFRSVLQDLDHWQPDRVIVAGDVINRGPMSPACLEIVREKEETAGWQVVRGNHEDYVIEQGQPNAPRSGPRFDLSRASYYTYQKVNDHLPYLESMPFQQEIIGPDGRLVRVVHASMKTNRVGIYPWTEDEALPQMIAPAPAVLVVGHTHWPLIRRLDETLVINAGSVGMTVDSDRRASYARLTWDRDGRCWQARIVRLDYDYETAEKDYFETDYMEGAGFLAELMLAEVRLAQGHLHVWKHKYEPAILRGEISMPDSIQHYMTEAGLL